MITNPLVAMIEESIRLKDSAQVILTAAIGGTSLSRLERLVLISICEAPEPLTVPQIGRGLGHTRQVVQRAANRLEELGLVQKAPNPEHKTAALLRPTAKGTRFEEEVRMKLEAIIGEVLSADDLRQCERITRNLRKLHIKLALFEAQNGRTPD